MGQPTGQRVQILTFSGSVYLNTKVEFNSSNGVAVQAGKVTQELSGDSASDALPARSAAKATGLLTLSGNATGLVAATGTLTLTGNALDTETVVVGSKTYTFQATLTNVDGNVQIGASASDTLDNLIAAIGLGAGAGTAYAAAMTSPGEVTATAGTGDTMDVEAVTAGAAGNSLASTETLTNGSWGGATLSGGQDDGSETVTVGTKTYTFQDTLTDTDGNVLIGATAADTLSNLAAAINLGDGAGATYAASTTSPSEVTASVGSGTTLGVEAVSGGTGGNSLASTASMANGSWGGSTLSGGATTASSNGYFAATATTS